MAPNEADSFLDSAGNTQDVRSWQVEVEKAAEDGFAGATKDISHTDEPEHILRRLSIIGRPHSEGSIPHTGPDILHPGAKVSGRVISAVFCVPFSIRYRKTADWVS